MKQRKLNAYLLLFAITAVAGVTMRTIASFFDLNDYGYYEGDLFRISALITVAGALLLACYALLHRKDAPKRASFGGMLTYVPGTLLAISLVLLGVSLIAKKAEGKLAPMLFPLLGILAILGAFYFLLAVLHESKLCDLRAAAGIVCTLFLILYAGYLYFDTQLAINAPIKLADQMAYIAAALFFLQETKISLGRENWPFYTAMGFIAALLCAYASIPALLVYFFDGRLISNSLEEMFVTLFLFAYILCRTILSLLLKGDKATPLMAALHKDAEDLAAAAAANGPLPFEPAPAEATEEVSTEQVPTETAPDEASASENESGEEAADSEEPSLTQEDIE